MQSTAKGILSDIKVVDLTQMVAGPFGTYQLVLQGAEVTRVEQIGGDSARFFHAQEPLRSLGLGPHYLAYNANKRSIMLDLKSEEGKQILHKMIGEADVLVESFRPGVMTRLGFDPVKLRLEYPALIICSVTGFGQTGPYSKRPAYDQIMQAGSGIMSLNGTKETGPMRTAFPVIDSATGLNTALAIMTALYAREQTGKGDHVDVALLDTALMLMLPVASLVMVNDENPSSLGNTPFTGSPFSGTFQTADGYLALAGNTAKQCKSLCEMTGLIELAELTPQDWHRLGDGGEEKIRALVAGVMLTRSAVYWEENLNQISVPCARVRTIREAVLDPNIVERGIFGHVENVGGSGVDVMAAGAGYQSAENPACQPKTASRAGEDGRAVLEELGYDVQSIERFIEHGAMVIPI